MVSYDYESSNWRTRFRVEATDTATARVYGCQLALAASTFCSLFYFGIEAESVRYVRFTVCVLKLHRGLPSPLCGLAPTTWFHPCAIVHLHAGHDRLCIACSNGIQCYVFRLAADGE